jgi:hypothetical protein
MNVVVKVYSMYSPMPPQFGFNRLNQPFGPPPSRFRPPPRRFRPRAHIPSMVCYRCNKSGHMIRDCPVPSSSSS